jgi:cytochrome P450 monooxygenase
MTATEDLPTLASVQPQLGRLNPLMRELQRQGPICRIRTHTGDEGWLVTRHAELKQLLLDHRLGPTHADPPNRSRYLEHPLLDLLIVDMDPELAREEHVRVRASLTPHFSARRMASLRPRIAARVNDLIDVITDIGPPLDIHATMSLPLSFQVLCDLLEIPDRDTYLGLLRETGQVADPNRKPGRLKLFAYLAEVAVHKRAHPDEGLISSLCEAGIDNEKVAALIAMISISYQVTPNNISAGIALFALNPDQRHLLAEDPELMSQAIEEVLRMGKVGESFVPRYASEDFEIGGVTIRTGDLVLCDHYAAGFDERVFDSPEQFDVTRSPNPHLAFSRGITHCIGAPLARLEMTEVFTGLFNRLPALRLAAEEDRIYALTRQLGAGIVELPVTWS